jgi:hypothetical protein
MRSQSSVHSPIFGSISNLQTVINKLLLISNCKPFGNITVDTARRCIKSVLSDSGIDGSYGARSVRGASTSAVLDAGANINDIMEHVSWVSETTVAKHYHKPIVNKFKFGENVNKMLMG